MFRSLVVGVMCAGWLAVPQAFAFGNKGHTTVGAIADKRLEGSLTAGKIADLLDGLTLAQAALLPDTLKSYDKHPEAFTLPGHAALTAQLVAFLKANPVSDPTFNHHFYHYTDVPVEGSSKYDSGTVGRPDQDVVHMIRFCVGVLNGTQPDNNPRKITKPVALILLAHYVGDIHQPLHVGAEYFDNAGKPVNPDDQPNPQPNGDKGGQGLTLHVRDSNGHLESAGGLHGYWDDTAVKSAMALLQDEIFAAGGGSSGVTDVDIVKHLAAKTPAGWAVSTKPIGDWSKEWADEILPVARAAHQRLTFTHMSVNAHKHTAAGQAEEKPVAANTDSYAEFAGKVTRNNIHMAGWRLALLLEKAL